MFCGWRLIFNYPVFDKAGSGLLEIDVLTRKCALAGKPLPRLPIADELHGWLARDLTANRMQLDDLIEARIAAQLTLREIPASARSTNSMHFEPMSSRGVYIECRIDCSSRVATNDAEYVSRHHDIEEWPKGR